VKRGTKRSAAGRKGERGVALVAFAISMGALFGLAAVAIDIGRISMVANETQNVADIAATAGAVNLLNSGTATTARADAQSVVAQNWLAGAAAAIATSDIQVGQYNPQTNTFTNGASPPDAVKATKSTTVQNLFAGFFGPSFMNSTVTRSATAGFTGPGQAGVTLPLVIGDCDFGSLSQCTLDPTCLPTLSQAPATSNNTGWIKNDSPYYPAACGGPSTPTIVNVGDSLGLQGGQGTGNWLRSVENCFNQGIREFTVPIVSCAKSNFNQSAIVVGFATIDVTSIVDTGSAKGLNLNAVFKEDTGAPAGGGAYGMGKMRLYN
jgi:Flp pilus assembly protein TadG